MPATDAGSFIDNNAVVTVRTQETEPREFQATASSSVGVSDVAENVATCLVLDVKRELSADEQLPTWTYNAPAGKLITGYCYKYSTTVVGPQPLDPPAPSVTFSSGGPEDISHFTIDLICANGTDVTSEAEECPPEPSSIGGDAAADSAACCCDLRRECDGRLCRSDSVRGRCEHRHRRHPGLRRSRVDGAHRRQADGAAAVADRRWQHAGHLGEVGRRPPRHDGAVRQRRA